MEYELGERVVFTDEYGNRVEGTIVSLDAYDVKGMIGIHTDDGYGIYCRKEEEIERR